jgi:hypothetical protein
MGTTDKATHTLTCSCGAEESQTIRESGSQYGATWGSGKPFDQFQVEWKRGDFLGPEVDTAICNTCGNTPVITVT